MLVNYVLRLFSQIELKYHLCVFFLHFTKRLLSNVYLNKFTANIYESFSQTEPAFVLKRSSAH